MTAHRVRRVGLLFETREDIVGPAGSDTEDTQYHWREPREVEAVERALTDLGLEVTRIGSLERVLAAGIGPSEIDLAFNLSVRTVTRSRTAVSAALMEILGIPCAGADTVARAVTLNKDLWKPIARQLGIETPDWSRFGPGDPLPDVPPWPASVVKPVCEGYSLGLRLVDGRSRDTLGEAVEDVRSRFGVPVLCERFVAGPELVVAVLGHAPAKRRVAVSELTAPPGSARSHAVLDTRAKRRGGWPRRQVAAAEATEAVAAAGLMSDVLGPTDYSTFDFRVDAEGRANLIDINFDATLHPDRALASTFACTGVEYGEVIEAILESAVDRLRLRL